MSLITATNFDVSKLSVSAPKKMANGLGQNVYLNYDSKRFRVQAPRMSLAYDSKDYNDNKKYKVDLSFRGQDSNPKIAAYHTMLQAIDAFVLDAAVSNSAAWFGKAKSKDAVVDQYTSSVKVSKKDYPSTHQVALSERDGKWSTELFDSKNQELKDVTPLQVLKRGAEVTPLMEVGQIWIVNGRFGLTWRLLQARIDVPGEGSTSTGFMGLDDDGAPVVTGVSATEESDLLKAVGPADEEEEEDEEEQEEEEEEVVAPPPVPVKKAAAAAKKSVPIKKAGAGKA